MTDTLTLGFHAFELPVGGPTLRLGGETFHEFEVTAVILLGFRLADHRLAQDVHGETHPAGAQLLEDRDGVRPGSSRDELARHPANAESHRRSDDPGGDPACLDAQAKGTSQSALVMLEVFVQVSHDTRRTA